MSELNEFVHLGRQSSGVTLPSSFVRPVSLDRIRGMSAAKVASSPANSKQTLTDTMTVPLSNRSHQQTGGTNLCQKFIDKKLFGANNSTSKAIKSTLRSEQLYRQSDKREERRAVKVKEQQDDELKGCTFRPKTLVESTDKRSLQEFLDSQDNHCKKTANKLDLLRKELDKEKIKEATFKPRINKHIATSGQSKQNIHSRLYELSRSKDNKENLDKHSNNNSAKKSREQSRNKPCQVPRISKPSLSSVPSMSNIPSASRIPSVPKVQSIKSIDRSSKSGSTSVVPSCVSASTDRQLVRKIVKQLCSACQHLGIFDRMSYLELGSLMISMRFVNEETVDRRYLYALWALLQGDINQYVYTHNLCKVVCSIMGIHNQQVMQKEIQQSHQQILMRPQYFESDSGFDSQRSKTLTFREGVIELTQKASREVKRELEGLYINRLNKDSSKSVSFQQPSFKPIISEASKDLAERRREKVIEETIELLKNHDIQYDIGDSGEISHADYLILQKKGQDYKLNKMVEERQAMKEEEFESLFRNQPVVTTQNPQRYLDLYAMSTLKSRRDRTSEEVDLERFKKDLTFKPNTLKGNCTERFQPVAKDVDKAIFRMYEGRKLRDKEDSVQKSGKKVPLLYLNINIDNKQTQRLEIFQGDDPNELAYRFGSKFGLNPQAKKRLSQLILTQLKQLI